MGKLSSQTTKTIALGLAAAASASLLLYIYRQQQQNGRPNKKKGSKTVSTDNTSTTAPAATEPGVTTPTNKDVTSNLAADDKTPLIGNTSSDKKSTSKDLHVRIEELDKKGKVLFKNKQYLEAAEAFTEALDLIESSRNNGSSSNSSSLMRQLVTLMNNRSAMYEKGDQPELALEDCVAILEREINHTKARTRKLRLLEGLQRYSEALVEVCAIQLLYMQTNRANLRMGLPVPPSPVPQSKMEEVLNQILPDEMARYTKELESQTERKLPSPYTVLQLLKSYTNYNSWMAKAAKDGSVDTITSLFPEAKATFSTAKRASLLVKRGRRYVYDRKYEKAAADFAEALRLAEERTEVQEAMEKLGSDASYAKLLEWCGMTKHWQYDLEGAIACYQKAADADPTNALILVKMAGVKMDAGSQDEAMKLFDTALGLDGKCADALLHRSNLYMLQQKPDEAKADLEKCLDIKPNHVMARLRLASILAAMNDASGAKKQLDKAEQVEPSSSEVQSYRGELYFTQNDMEEARKQFEKAMQLEPTNPTPYVNAAMALLNTPAGPGHMPDAVAVMELLEKAIDVDPQFTAAYIQLGQLKLGTATDLKAAREVIGLYDTALKNCRSPEEIKELCSMRALAVAQVDAATSLGMETFNV